MAQDLQVVRNEALALISSPDLKRLRRISLGTVQWEGMPPRKYLSGGSTLSTSDRERAESLLDEIERRTVSGPEEDTQRFGLITKMLLAYPIANATAATGAARGEAYREALNDIPPAALDAAIKRWHRGECGEDHDYRWAPAPAVLRTICLQSTEPLRLAGHDLRTLLSAITLDRAMDPTPIESEPQTPALRRMA